MVVEEVRQPEEAATRSKAIKQASQGRWVRWEVVERKHLTWSDVWSTESNRMSFIFRATYDVLPSPTNQQLWLGKDPLCFLCKTPAMLSPILVSCRTTLTQRRYTWRHNQVVRCQQKQRLSINAPQSKPPSCKSSWARSDANRRDWCSLSFHRSRSVVPSLHHYHSIIYTYIPIDIFFLKNISTFHPVK